MWLVGSSYTWRYSCNLDGFRSRFLGDNRSLLDRYLFWLYFLDWFLFGLGRRVLQLFPLSIGVLSHYFGTYKNLHSYYFHETELRHDQCHLTMHTYFQGSVYRYHISSRVLLNIYQDNEILSSALIYLLSQEILLITLYENQM